MEKIPFPLRQLLQGKGLTINNIIVTPEFYPLLQTLEKHLGKTIRFFNQKGQQIRPELQDLSQADLDIFESALYQADDLAYLQVI